MNYDHQFLVWNCRGAGSRRFERSLKLLVQERRPVLVRLLETRVSHTRAEEVFHKIGLTNFVAVPGLGFSGGIWVAWRDDELKFSVLKENAQYVHLAVKGPSNLEWVVTIAYVGPRERDKCLFWEEMFQFTLVSASPWFLLGDFNDIRDQGEKKGGAPILLRRCELFNERINRCSLMDVGTWGNRFTWKGLILQGYERSFERLDRGMCNVNWRCSFLNAMIKVLTRIGCSDHNPLLLCLGERNKPSGERPFRFEAAWLLHNNFEEMLQKNWNREGKFNGRLNKLRDSLISRNREVFRSIHKRKKLLVARLDGIQKKISNCNRPSPSLIKLEDNLQKELEDVLSQEEILWYQKSRREWINDGDRNTKFYHVRTLDRRRRNKVAMLKRDGEIWVEDQEELKEMAKDFFIKLFTEEKNSDQQDLGVTENLMITFPTLPSKEIEWMDRDIVDEEVRDAMFSIGAFKAPGEDGFPAIFF
ncbi:uncharacterized protein LOC114762247 [Neltuma alba]|uniref:uncharacterized protein LOC114762247 n=1 Tax=Neltuma alba TaxID=207710 RepID=UPI0010A2CF9D|nr:uncharacterized protein LOC114762247 [Prosopis alba]